MKYVIVIKKNENIQNNILTIVNYLGVDKCFSTYYNYYLKYNSKTRDINIENYIPLTIEKHTNNIFDHNFIKGLASQFIKDSFLHIEAKLNDSQLEYLHTLEFIEKIEIKIKYKIHNIDNKVGDNTYNNYKDNQPNTNFALQAQNIEFVNDLEKKIFNYTKDDENKIYTYNPPEITEPIDIIVIDESINGTHENFIIDGVNICKIEEQKKLPWRLSKLLKLQKVEFKEDDSTPEGVDINDANFVSYFSPNNKDSNHGTHVAGIICGKNTGWIRSKSVNLYSINFKTNTIYRELAILDFQINKIKNGNNTPTFINRSYGKDIKDPTTPNTYSNFKNQYVAYDFTINASSFKFNLDLSDNIVLYEIQKKLKIFNFWAAGNDSELQTRWSDDPKNIFNYAHLIGDTYRYIYIPKKTCINNKYWTIYKKKLDDLTIEDISNMTTLYSDDSISIDYDLIKKDLDNNKNNIFKILNKQSSSFVVGSLGVSINSLALMDENRFNKENEYLYMYMISGFSAFGDGLIYSLGGNIRSSIGYHEGKIVNDMFANEDGSSMACPNLLAMVAIHIMKKHPKVDINVDDIIKLLYTSYPKSNGHIYCPVPMINLQNGELSMIDLWNTNTTEYLLKDIQLTHKIKDYKQIYPLSHQQTINPPPIPTPPTPTPPTPTPPNVSNNDTDLTNLSLVIKSSKFTNSFLKLIKNNNSDNLNQNLAETALTISQLSKQIQQNITTTSKFYDLAEQTAQSAINAAKAFTPPAAATSESNESVKSSFIKLLSVEQIKDRQNKQHEEANSIINLALSNL